MKRSIIKKTGIALAIVASLCWVAFISEGKDNSLSDLAFSNIEALASGEGGGEMCFGYGSIYCAGSYYKERYTR